MMMPNNVNTVSLDDIRRWSGPYHIGTMDNLPDVAIDIDASTIDNPNHFIPGFGSGGMINVSPNFEAMNTNINNNDEARLEYAKSLFYGFKNIYNKNTSDYIKSFSYTLDERRTNRMNDEYKKWLIRMAKCAIEFMKEYEFHNATILKEERTIVERRNRNEL